MRTTVDIDDDVLLAVQELARQRKATIERVVSELLRESLDAFGIEYRDGVPVLRRTPGSPLVTTELVNQLLNDGD